MSVHPVGRNLLLACAVALSMTVPALAVSDDGVAGERRALPALTASSDWSLRLPKEERVVFHGMANFDEAGAGSSAMLYPAPSMAGLLAAVVTHGLILGSVKQSQKDKLQEAADKVLDPYQPVLQKFSNRELLQRALEKTSAGGTRKLVEPDGAPVSGIWIESTPVFAMTPDQNAIVLDAAVAIYLPGDSSAAYRNMVRVVSAPRDTGGASAFWMANAGAKLKEESVGLMAQSLDIALADAAAGTGPLEEHPFRTVRYREGGADKMERAQVLSEACDRLVIRTLRGGLMSVPKRRGATPAASGECSNGNVQANN
ncbi:MAG: hypothetical protein HGA47_06985 [Zoogloea sp.]|nr:hypothetical protein [Zoogloea sp.]